MSTATAPTEAATRSCNVRHKAREASLRVAIVAPYRCWNEAALYVDDATGFASLSRSSMDFMRPP